MQIGIVGLGQSGKSTLFNALSASHQPTGLGAKEANRAVVKVPDERLYRLAEMFDPQKITHATVEYVDIPNPRGEGKLDPAYLNLFRPVDLLVVVLDAFTYTDAGELTRSVAEQWAEIRSELILADLAVVEKKIETLDRMVRIRHDAESVVEQELFLKLRPVLDEGRPLYERTFEVEEERQLRGYKFLSLKPILLVLNLSDTNVPQASALAASLAPAMESAPVSVIPIAGQIEAELAELEPEEQVEFLAGYGITEPALPRAIRESFRLLNMISFLTAGEPEVRAWPIPAGTNAVNAAATIHSDIARGFIRAELVPFDRLMEAGSQKEASHRGWVRLEGKEYIVQDGDVIYFRFNV